MRVANRSAVAGAVTIVAHDDSDTSYETLAALALGAGETAHFNSDDLELGNAAKGLTGSTGSGGAGAWRLVLSSGLDIEAHAYIRTTEGFLTAMNAAAPKAGGVHRVAFFNPGSNADQVSVLRLVNRSSGEAEVSLDGTDDLGLRPGTTVRVLVPATDAVETDGCRVGVRGARRDRVRRAWRRDRQVAAAGRVASHRRRAEPAVEPVGGT